MKTMKMKTATDFRASLFETIQEVHHGDPQLVTFDKGADAIVLISKNKLNALVDRAQVIADIEQGRAEIAAGLGIPQAEVKERVKGMIAKWQKQKKRK